MPGKRQRNAVGNRLASVFGQAGNEQPRRQRRKQSVEKRDRKPKKLAERDAAHKQSQTQNGQYSQNPINGRQSGGNQFPQQNIQHGQRSQKQQSQSPFAPLLAQAVRSEATLLPRRAQTSAKPPTSEKLSFPLEESLSLQRLSPHPSKPKSPPAQTPSRRRLRRDCERVARRLAIHRNSRTMTERQFMLPPPASKKR